MKRQSLHRGMELRLEVLRYRIQMLADKTSRAEGIQRIEYLGDIARLERRYGRLKSGLDELNRVPPGFWHGMKNEFEKLSSDLLSTFGDFIMRIDAGYSRSSETPTASPATQPIGGNQG